MKKLIIILLFMLLMVTGCGDSHSLTLPPGPDQVKGSVKNTNLQAINPADVLAEAKEFRQKNIDELKKIYNDNPEPAAREKILLEAWKDYYEIYNGWYENGGQTHNKSGIRIYGPVASVWLNEIYLSMARLENLIVDPNATTEQVLLNAPVNFEPEKYNLTDFTFHGLQGLCNENEFACNTKTKQKIKSDYYAANDVVAMLNACSYPFSKNSFINTEVYLYPAEQFQNQDSSAWGYTACFGLTPCNNLPVRVIIPYSSFLYTDLIIGKVNSLVNLGHELGHAWVRERYIGYNNNIIKSYLKNRGIDDSQIPEYLTNDDVAVGNTLLFSEDGKRDQIDYDSKPVENLAEDFNALFFGQKFRFNYPDIYGDEKNKDVRDRLREYFTATENYTFIVGNIPKIIFDERYNLKIDTSLGKLYLRSTKGSEGEPGAFDMNVPQDGSVTIALPVLKTMSEDGQQKYTEIEISTDNLFLCKLRNLYVFPVY